MKAFEKGAARFRAAGLVVKMSVKLPRRNDEAATQAEDTLNSLNTGERHQGRGARVVLRASLDHGQATRTQPAWHIEAVFRRMDTDIETVGQRIERDPVALLPDDGEAVAESRF